MHSKMFEHAIICSVMLNMHYCVRIHPFSLSVVHVFIYTCTHASSLHSLSLWPKPGLACSTHACSDILCWLAHFVKNVKRLWTGPGVSRPGTVCREIVKNIKHLLI